MTLTNVRIPSRIDTKTLGDFYQVKKQYLNLNSIDTLSQAQSREWTWSENQYKNTIELNKINIGK